MRLGQLARKLSLRPSQLVDFLATHQIETAEGSNTRLADEHARMIILNFAPESLEEITSPATEPEVQSEPEPVEQVVQSDGVVEHEPVTKPEEREATVNQELPAEQQGEPEVIRVQRIELSGLKVLGKIELPEPKKKEPKAEGEGSAEEQKPERKGKSKQPRRERDTRNNWRNPFEVQRQREAREKEEKRKAEIEREKEKRKLHYETKVKQVKAAKRPKPVNETPAVKKPVDTRPVPKTWIGKFLRWWTT